MFKWVDATKFPALTIDEVEAWAKSLAPQTNTGNAGDGSNCPLHTYWSVRRRPELIASEGYVQQDWESEYIDASFNKSEARYIYHGPGLSPAVLVVRAMTLEEVAMVKCIDARRREWHSLSATRLLNALRHAREEVETEAAALERRRSRSLNKVGRRALAGPLLLLPETGSTF